jgi:hypothetical protein
MTGCCRGTRRYLQVLFIWYFRGNRPRQRASEVDLRGPHLSVYGTGAPTGASALL